jgi:uncharacterized protein YndB with AHSA1/START domain
MRPVFASAPIDAPRERVFDLLCDLSRRPAFTGHFQHDYRLERIQPVGVGASARFRLARSASSWMDSVIDEAERPQLIRERGRGGRTNRIAVFTVWELVESPGPGGCEVSVTFWTEPSAPFDKIHEPFPSPRRLRREWARALRRMRALVEAGGPIEGIGVAGGERPPTVVA